jgi:antitoxin component of MazEF toxin-antitoxin module
MGAIVKLLKWGNSAGICIPLNELKTAHAFIGEKFKITANKKGGFTLVPIKDLQAGWLEAFNAAADAEDDIMLIEDVENEFDKDEWQW